MPPKISIVVLALDALGLTQRCVESLERTIEAEHELVLVDNGSRDGTREWMAATGHPTVLNDTNLGFAAGMNSGLRRAEGEFVVFANNDTLFPGGWDTSVLEVFDRVPTAGIVAPAVTAAGNPATVRTQVGSGVRVFEPFGHLPSGVVYVMRTDQMRRLGGWNEDYLIATGEDLDLLWTVWANGLDVVLDERILVEHVSEATRRKRTDMEEIRKRNLELFLQRWETSSPPPSRLEEYPLELFQSNLRHAAAGAIWLRRLVEARTPTKDTSPASDRSDASLLAKSTRRSFFPRRR